MIDCSDGDKDNKKSFVEFYERENGKIRFYTPDGEYLLDDTLDNLVKIRNVMNGQACVNAGFTKKRVGETILATFLLPYFSHAFHSSLEVFSDNTLFNMIFFGLCVSALVTDIYCIVSRSRMIYECLKDKYFINNIDYINKHINDESISELFKELDSFRDEDGKLYIDINDINRMRLYDLFILRMIIEQDIEDRKDDYTKKR